MTRTDRRPDVARPRPDRTPTSRVPQGLVVGLCVLALSCVGAIVYAGQAAAEVAYRLIVEGGIVLVWLGSAAGWGVWLFDVLAGARHQVRVSRLLRGVTAIAVGLGVMGLVVLGLGLAGLLSQSVAIAILVLGVVGGVAKLLARSRGGDGAAPSTPDADGPPTPSGPTTSTTSTMPPDRWNWLWLAVVPAGSLVLVSAFVPSGLLWKPHEPHGYDVVEYHFQLPREWHEAGRIQPTPHNVFGYFPFGAEMHDLLAFHLSGGAWQGLYLAQLMHVATMVLAGLAMYGFALQDVRSRLTAVTAAVLGATVPWLAQLAPIGFNESALLLFGTLAVGWTRSAFDSAAQRPTTGVPSAEDQRDRSDRHDRSDRSDSRSLAVRPFVIAGLCAGFACGVKLTAIPLLLLAIPAVAGAVSLWRPDGESRRRATAAIGIAVAGFLIAAAVVLAPWLIRNVAWTGNPVFPEGRSVFGDGPFSPTQAARWDAAHTAQPSQQSVPGRLTAFAGQVILNRQFGYVLFPLAAVALALHRRSRQAALLCGLLAVQVLFWLAFTHLQGRFFVLAVPVAVLAVASAPWEHIATSRPSVRRWAAAVAGIGIVLAAGLQWYGSHRQLAVKLYEEQGTGVVVALGQEDLSWITAVSLEGFPLNDPAARLVLVGDAQAFWYPLPASRLSYRTVFDLNTSPDIDLLQAFDPQNWRRDGRTWLLVSPAELERYEKTYQPFPKIPQAWRQSPEWQAGLPFLLPPSAVPQWEQAGR